MNPPNTNLKKDSAIQDSLTESPVHRETAHEKRLALLTTRWRTTVNRSKGRSVVRRR